MIAIFLALCAGLGYAIATVLQQRVAARQAPELSLRPALILLLVRRPLWLLGLAFDGAAFGLEAAALGSGHVIEVAPFLVSSLLFAVPLSTVGTTRRMTAREWRLSVAVTAALALFAWIGSPHGARAPAGPVAWLCAGAFVGCFVAVCLAASRHVGTAKRPLLYGVATGAIYGLTAVLTKVTVDLLDVSIFGGVAHWQPYALLASSGVALLLNQSAFQAGHVAASVPAMSVVGPVLASVFGAALLGEHLRVHSPAAFATTAAAVAVMVYGTISLACSPLVQCPNDGLKAIAVQERRPLSAASVTSGEVRVP